MRDPIRTSLAAGAALAVLLASTFASEAQEAAKCNFGKNPTREQYRILLLHQNSDEFKLFDGQCTGRPDHKAYLAWLESKIVLPLHDYDRLRRAGVRAPLPDTGGAPPPKAGGWQSYLILRDSCEDVAVFSSPKDVKLASGASLTWSNDRIAANRSWTAKGVAAYPIVWQNPDNPAPRSSFDPYLVGLAFTPTVAINRVTNSNAQLVKNNIDVLTFGGAAEVAVGHMFDETTTHYFRARVAAAGTTEGTVKSIWDTVEYQPITNFANFLNVGSPNPLGPIPATFEIDAIYRAQYATRTVMTLDPIFANREHIFRSGPVLALSIIPQQGPDSPVPKLLQRFNFVTTYSWLEDPQTHQTFWHWLASLGFALDDNGNVGIKLSYEKGQVEQTGQPVDLTKVGLTAKF